MASRSDRLWDALDRFRTSRWGVALFFGYLVGILIAAILIGAAINSNHRIAVQAKSAAEIATRSLCFQKRAGIAQLQGAKRFLRHHPHGTPDFSRALIVNAIRTDEVDVAALRDVRCPLGE